MSIQISLSGLSFSILNRSTNSIELLKHVHLEKKATPFELLNNLKVIIESNSDFEQDFDSVICIYQNELACLVPEALFDEKNVADYLKFNAKILKTDYISFDKLITNESMNVYVPLVNINNYIFDTFGSFDFKHASTVLIETVLQLNSKVEHDIMHINVNTSTFEIIYIQEKKLTFYNTFEFTTKEDFIYYILFSVEQLQLNPETIKVVLSGGVNKEDDLFNIVYKYIRFVEFAQKGPNYNIEIEGEQNFDHNDFIILNSFT